MPQSLPAPSAPDYVLSPRYELKSVPQVTAVRSSGVSSSIKSLDALGLLEVYAKHLPSPQVFAELRELLPATWLDLALARHHYQALDALQLSDLTRVALAKQAGG